MSNSLLTGVSGLQANQEMLDVVGNNLANMNTIGFKSQSVNFSDLIYQTLSAAGGTNTAQASGTDPIQIGLGVGTASVETSQTQGDLQSTGRALDVAIQGNGYFVLKSPDAGDVYTRAGSFGIDSQGFLVDPSTGYRVQRTGTVGDPSPTSAGFQVPGNDDIQIPQDTTIPGNPTSTVTIQGNLDSSDTGPIAQTITTSAPLTAGGAAATSTTLLNGLDGNTADYVSGDSLTLSGTDATGTAVNLTVPVDDTTTVGDLVNDINTSFPGATASLSATGNIVVTANTPGQSNLNLTIGDTTGNTGKTSWASNAPTVTTAGANGATVNGTVQVYDAQGAAHDLSFTFQKQTDGTWNLTTSMDPKDGTLTQNTVTGISFNNDGSFQQVNGAGGVSVAAQFAGETSTQTIAFNFGAAGGFSGLTQVGGTSSAAATAQNGYAAGSLTDVTIDQDGVINGDFSNGQTLQIAQLGIASFANQDALDRDGNNYFSSTTESGPAQVSTGEAGGNGEIEQKVLEESNVDVSLEFTRLITAQRGFEINAKTITVSDEVLQDLAQIVQ
jgi:flagellar hook protein FlgE